MTGLHQHRSGGIQRGARSCYRVLMFDPRIGLHWQPIFAGKSPNHAVERALVAYPTRTVVDVVALPSEP